MKRVEWTQERVDKVKEYLKGSPFGEDAMLFSFIAADNDVDKENERFSLKSLKTIASLLIGKRGQIGLSANCKYAGARVIETNVKFDPNKKTKYGWAYIYVEAIAFIQRNMASQKICEKIDNDEITEVSLGVSCGHKHKSSDCTILTDVTDVYEWSLVEKKLKPTIEFNLLCNGIVIPAEAPKDMTLEQLLNQVDKINPKEKYSKGISSMDKEERDYLIPSLVFDYDSVVKGNNASGIEIIED
jgi:hypothetical protein